jgi:hypothetical protein
MLQPAVRFSSLGLLLALLALAGPGCTVDDKSGAATGGKPGAGTGGAAIVGGTDGELGSAGWSPLSACAPVLEQRVTRLSDGHIAHAIADLLGIAAPELETGALSEAAFIPGKAATVNGAAASKLQDIAEKAAQLATASGSSWASCGGNEQDCAAALLDDFAARAYRRPLSAQERTELLAVFKAGRDADANYAGGVSLVIETVLQSPNFLYFGELGSPVGETFRLSGYEVATKLAFLLRDSLPDAGLWQAARSGALETEAGVAAEVDRLLAEPAVRQNLSRMFARLFQLDVISTLERPQLAEWPGLAQDMHREATRFVNDVLWQGGGTLAELLTSRKAELSPALAAFYGVAAGPGQAAVALTLPENRSGILTRAGVMAAKADTRQTSVVYRGLQVARGLLCVETPPPPASIVAQIEASKAEVVTERARSEKRQTTPPCSGCHASFDPFGVTFEHYDSLGRYRDTIPMPTGDVPVDSAWDIQIADIHGSVKDAVELSQRLSESKAARECMSRQIASYAIGEKLTSEQACTVAALAQRFEASGGDLRGLIKDVALWPALRSRKAAP